MRTLGGATGAFERVTEGCAIAEYLSSFSTW